MLELAGYWMNYAEAHKIANHLSIDVGENTEYNNRNFEWLMNNWLHDNGKLHIKSAGMSWPEDGQREDGIFFMTQYRPFSSGNSPMTERMEDLGVKKWLEECCAERMLWVSFLDQNRITLLGLQPRHFDRRFQQVSLQDSLNMIMVRRDHEPERQE